MRMRQYICHTDHNLWDVIVNGDLEEEPAPTGETSAPPALKTAKQLAAKRNHERVKSILLLAIPAKYLLKFHNVADAKSLWEAIKSRFKGNEESKKMQKNVLKHQFEKFFTASNESLDKAYDTFQTLISQLEVHGAPILKEDINQKFLRSLPPSWNQIALIMRNKPEIDEIDIDDLYNNLRVYEDEMKRSSSSTSTSQNLAFLSSKNTSNTNEVSTTNGDFGVSTARGISQVSSTPCAHDVACSFFAQPTTSPQLENEDFQQINEDDFGKKKIGSYNAPTNESSSQALVAQDGLGGYDWSNDFEVKPVNYDLMTISSSSSSSSSDNEVQKCSKQCLESFKTLQKNYDSEREKHSRARLEIQGYELALESLESRILVHEKNELAWGEKYEFQNYELKCREIKINNLNLELEKIVKERDELKLKIEKWEESSKNPDELLNSQMSARDKTGLGYGTQLNEMNNNSETDSEISLSVFYVRSSDEVNKPSNDNLSKVDGFHAVPPPITRNFLTPRANISFVDHLIKDCKFHDKQSQEPKLKTVINSGPRVNKPVWDNTKRVNHRNFSKYPHLRKNFVPSGVLTRTGLIIPVKQNEKRAVHTGNPKILLQDHAVVDRGCSSHMTGNKAYLSDYEDFNGGFVAFRSDPKGGKITGKGKIRTANLDFDDVYFVDELKFNLFSVSQMCDKKNSVLFTKTECLILSPSFKLLDESQVVLRAPRKDDVYSLDLKNIVPSGDSLGKFDGKSDEGYLLGYSTTSKAFRVYNKRTKRVEENLHIDFLEDQPNVAGTGPNWMFDLDFLTNTMNYIPVSVENQVNVDAGTQDSYVAGSSGKDKEPTQEYILLPLHPHRTRILVEDVADKEGQHQMTEDEQVLHDELEKMIAQEVVAKALDDATRQAFEEEKRNIASQKRAAQATSINKLSTGRSSVSTATTLYVSAASTPTGANAGESSFVYLGGKLLIDASTPPNADLPIDPNMPDLEDDSDAFSNDGIFNRAYDDENVGAVADFNNMDDTINVSPIPTLRIHKDHPKDQILGDPKLAIQTRGKIQKVSSAQQALVSYISKQNRTNHKDHQNCLLACFLSQEEPKNISQALQDESWVKAMKRNFYSSNYRRFGYLLICHLLKRQLAQSGSSRIKRMKEALLIEAIRLFLAFASYMGFTVYQMDVKSAFLYGTIKEEVRGTIDKTLFIKKNKSDIMLVQVYVDDIIFGSTKKSMCIEFEDCMHKRFQMSSMGELTFFFGLQVKQQLDGIFISQDKYVADILKKFDFCSIKTATTPIESNKPLVKDEDGVDVDVHVYRSMIGSLIYLTALRPDIMFNVCACARFQVTPKALYLNAVKRIFRRLISWQCKKQTIMANSTTEAEYVAVANCCGQVLLIHNQMMDYGFNLMNTKIHIDNESTISVIKNPVAHLRTKRIEIQFHFIRDCYEKRLIEVIKIHTNHNVADLLTKGFDVTRFNFLVVSIGLLNM
ncbi:putative ribonuclease H-like domain-containing protein [Tanacetum coccineum]